MARTKQTAKQSTGGLAATRNLVLPTRVLRSHSSRSRSPQPTPDVQMEEIPMPGPPAITASGGLPVAPAVGPSEVVGGTEDNDDFDNVSRFLVRMIPSFSI